MHTPDPDRPTLSPRQSTELLDGLDDLKRHARRSSGAPWLPLVLFGTITTLTSPLVAAFGMPILGAIWTVGGVIGFAVIVPYYRRRESLTGIGARRPVQIRISIAIFLACFVVAAIGGRSHDYAGPLLGPPAVDLFAYLSFGWYLRSWGVALAVVPGVAATGALFAVGASPPLVLLAFGLGQLVPGAIIWPRGARA